MMIELFDYFRNSNFTPIALPMNGFQPLQMLLREEHTDSYRKLGDDAFITNLFKTSGDVEAPNYKVAKKVASMKGTHGVSWNVRSHFSAEWMSEIEAKAAAAEQKQLIFIFDSPVADEISSLPVLEHYLNNAQIEANHAFAKRLLNNELYVITAVLKIKKFAVAVTDSSQADAQLQVPVLESLLSGGVEASATKHLTQIYHYEGDEPIAFAIQAVKVHRTQSLWELIWGQKGVFSIYLNKPLHIVRNEDELKVEYLIVPMKPIL